MEGITDRDREFIREALLKRVAALLLVGLLAAAAFSAWFAADSPREPQQQQETGAQPYA